MRTLRVAAVSLNGYLGDPERALGNIEIWCKRARMQGAELVLSQPHHAGGAMVFGPTGELLIEAQRERIKEEMVVISLGHELLDIARADPTYTLRTRRPELFADLVLDQVSA